VQTFDVIASSTTWRGVGLSIAFIEVGLASRLGGLVCPTEVVLGAFSVDSASFMVVLGWSCACAVAAKAQQMPIPAIRRRRIVMATSMTRQFQLW
jgi:hypothetical protein